MDSNNTQSTSAVVLPIASMPPEIVGTILCPSNGCTYLEVCNLFRTGNKRITYLMCKGLKSFKYSDRDIELTKLISAQYVALFPWRILSMLTNVTHLDTVMATPQLTEKCSDSLRRLRSLSLNLDSFNQVILHILQNVANYSVSLQNLEIFGFGQWTTDYLRLLSTIESSLPQISSLKILNVPGAFSILILEKLSFGNFSNLSVLEIPNCIVEMGNLCDIYVDCIDNIPFNPFPHTLTSLNLSCSRSVIPYLPSSLTSLTMRLMSYPIPSPSNDIIRFPPNLTFLLLTAGVDIVEKSFAKSIPRSLIHLHLIVMSDHTSVQSTNHIMDIFEPFDTTGVVEEQQPSGLEALYCSDNRLPPKLESLTIKGSCDVGYRWNRELLAKIPPSVTRLSRNDDNTQVVMEYYKEMNVKSVWNTHIYFPNGIIGEKEFWNNNPTGEFKSFSHLISLSLIMVINPEQSLVLPRTLTTLACAVDRKGAVTNLPQSLKELIITAPSFWSNSLPSSLTFLGFTYNRQRLRYMYLTAKHLEMLPQSLRFLSIRGLVLKDDISFSTLPISVESLTLSDLKNLDHNMLRSIHKTHIKNLTITCDSILSSSLQIVKTLSTMVVDAGTEIEPASNLRNKSKPSSTSSSSSSSNHKSNNNNNNNKKERNSNNIVTKHNERVLRGCLVSVVIDALHWSKPKFIELDEEQYPATLASKISLGQQYSTCLTQQKLLDWKRNEQEENGRIQYECKNDTMYFSEDGFSSSRSSVMTMQLER